MTRPDLTRAALTTRRLVMRAYKPADYTAAHTVLNDPEIARMTARIPSPCPLTFVESWCEEQGDDRSEGRGCEFGLFRRADGAYVGHCGLIDIIPKHDQCSVVYFIAREHRGQGYATEALRAALTFAFDRLGLERVSGRCYADNRVSGLVMERAGMIREGVLRHDLKRGQTYADVCLYGALRTDKRERV